MQPTGAVVPAAAPGGFDWADAAIGAGTSFGLILLITGSGAVLVRRRGVRTAAH